MKTHKINIASNEGRLCPKCRERANKHSNRERTYTDIDRKVVVRIGYYHCTYCETFFSDPVPPLAPKGTRMTYRALRACFDIADKAKNLAQACKAIQEQLHIKLSITQLKQFRWRYKHIREDHEEGLEETNGDEERA